MESANQMKDDTTAQSTAQDTSHIAFPPVHGVESPLALTSRLPENQYIDATPDRHIPYDQSMI